MSPIGLWAVHDDGPAKLSAGAIELEKHLEDWIERDAGLPESGLIIVGRQFRVEAGPIDLLDVARRGEAYNVSTATSLGKSLT